MLKTPGNHTIALSNYAASVTINDRTQFRTGTKVPTLGPLLNEERTPSACGDNAGVPSPANPPVATRPLTGTDLALVSRWLAQPHVAHWWRDPADLASVRQAYQPSIDGDDPTEVFVIEAEGRAAGLIQRYLIDDEPAWARAVRATGVVSGCAAGIDYLIGEPELTGRGYGTAAIAAFTALTLQRYPQADVVVAAPQQANVPSWRALARAGYTRWWSGQLDSDDPGDAGPAHLYGIRRPD
jgi:aminoglycoside 6'-N-acetyltransferase